MKIRRKVDPEKWPLPGLTMPNQTHTDFSQLINCPEFVPRQMNEEPRGERSDLLLMKLKYGTNYEFKSNYDMLFFVIQDDNKMK